MSRPPESRNLDVLHQRLLAAARLENPRASAKQRTILALAGGAALGTAATSAAALGVGAASGATTGVKAVAGAVSVLGIAKAVAIGAISGAVVLGAAQKIQEAPSAARAAATTARPSALAGRAASAAVPLHAKTTTAEEGAAVAEVSPPPNLAVNETLPQKLLAPPSLPPHVSASVPADEPRSSAPREPMATSLVEEVATLDRAREAVLAHHPRQALLILDDYERSPLGDRLSAEATLLRIRALLQLGDSVRAGSLAKAFLDRHPDSPVADRIRAVVDVSSRAP